MFTFFEWVILGAAVGYLAALIVLIIVVQRKQIIVLSNTSTGLISKETPIQFRRLSMTWMNQNFFCPEVRGPCKFHRCPHFKTLNDKEICEKYLLEFLP